MDLSEIINKIESLKKELDSLKPIKLEFEKKIWHKLRLDWNFHSNHIEGNSLTYGETKLLLETGHIAGTLTKPKRDYDEVIGHDKAIDIIRELAKNKTTLTEAIIRELHKTILPTSYKLDAQTPEGKPTKREILIGEYKRQPNHVLTSKGEVFNFAAPDETKPKMTELVDSFRKKKTISAKDILFLASEFHYKFVLIHPFDDGNGRIARLLLNYFLLLNDYPPILIKSEDKKNYFTALEASDAGNFESLVIYFGDRLIESFEIMIKGARGKELFENEDIDKEMLNLQMKLDLLEKEEKRIEKDDITVLKAMENSVMPLLSNLLNKISKVDEYFTEIQILFIVNQSHSQYHKGNALKQLEDLVRNNKPHLLQSIAFYYNLNGFKKAGVNDFNESIYFYFSFEKYKYILQYDNNTAITFEKLYDQFFTSEEIENLLNRIIYNLLERINKHIDKAKY